MSNIIGPDFSVSLCVYLGVSQISSINPLSLSLPPAPLPPVSFPLSGVSGQTVRVDGGSLDGADPPARTVASTPLGSASLTQAFWILSHHSSVRDPISTWELWSGPKLIHTHCFQAKHEFVPPFAHMLPRPSPSPSAWRTPPRPPRVQCRSHLLCDTWPTLSTTSRSLPQAPMPRSVLLF